MHINGTLFSMGLQNRTNRAQKESKSPETNYQNRNWIESQLKGPIIFPVLQVKIN